MKRIVMDSCVFVSLFVKRDVNHKKALKVWEDVRRNGMKILVPTLFLPEICGAIVRVTGDKKYANEVNKMLEKWMMAEIIIPKELTVERMAAAVEKAIKFNLRGGDAIFVSLAREFNTSFLTFDEEVKRKITGKIKLFEI